MPDGWGLGGEIWLVVGFAIRSQSEPATRPIAKSVTKNSNAGFLENSRAAGRIIRNSRNTNFTLFPPICFTGVYQKLDTLSFNSQEFILSANIKKSASSMLKMKGGFVSKFGHIVAKCTQRPPALNIEKAIFF